MMMLCPYRLQSIPYTDGSRREFFMTCDRDKCFFYSEKEHENKFHGGSTSETTVYLCAKESFLVPKSIHQKITLKDKDGNIIKKIGHYDWNGGGSSE